MTKLTSPSEIENLMRRYDLRFHKRFGQNFLIDENILNRIADAAEISLSDSVLEIGSGIGTLTQALALRAKKVTTVEIDTRLIPVLNETLSEYNNIRLVNSDFLRCDLSDLGFSQDESIKVVANLPYYVTTPIIMTLLESDLSIKRMTFLVQKEVGERLAAKPGTKAYGSLTVAARYYADCEKCFDVPASAFMPKPRVDSSVIALTRRPATYEPADKKVFFTIVKAAFLNRRKTLINSLTGNTAYDRETLIAAMTAVGIDPGVRGERLTGETFAELADQLTGKIK